MSFLPDFEFELAVYMTQSPTKFVAVAQLQGVSAIRFDNFEYIWTYLVKIIQDLYL